MSRYNKFSIDQKVELVDMLDNSTLASLVRYCFEHEDDSLLEIIRHQGRFGVDKDDLRSLARFSSPVLSEQCPAMVDVLAIYASESTSEKRDYTRIDESENYSRRSEDIMINGYRTTDTVKRFLRSVTGDIMHDLASTPEPILTMERDRRDVVMATLASIALVTNDPVQLEQVMSVNVSPGNDERSKGIMQRAMKLPMSHSPDFIGDKNPNTKVMFNPLGLGIYANSIEAIEYAINQDLNLISEPVGHFVNGYNQSSIFAFEVFHVTQTDPSIEMMDFLLESCKYLKSSSSAEFSYKNWLTSQLIPKSLDGTWPHLVEVCMRHGVYAANPEIAIEQSSKNLYPSVIEQVLPHFDKMTWPASRVNGCTWFHPNHPIINILDATGSEGGLYLMAEQSFEKILGRLKRNGSLKEVFDFEYEPGRGLAHTFIERDNIGALGFLIKNGLDVDAKNEKTGMSITDYAIDKGSRDSRNVIASTKSYNAALEILSELESLGIAHDGSTKSKARLSA